VGSRLWVLEAADRFRRGADNFRGDADDFRRDVDELRERSKQYGIAARFVGVTASGFRVAPMG